MPTLLKTKKADTILRWAACVLMAACASIFLLSLIRYSLKPVFLDIVPYPIAAVVLCWLVRGEYKARPVYWLGAAFVVWFGVTRVLLDHIFTRQPYYFLLEIAIIYIFIFPLARSLGTSKRLYALDLLAAALILVVTFNSVVGLTTVIINEVKHILAGYHWYGLSGGRLYILSLNPNIASPFIVLSIVLTLYLLLRYKKRWVWIIGGLMMVINYLTLSATASRASNLALSAAGAVVAAVGAARLLKRHFRGRAAVIAAITAAMIALCTWGFDLGAQLLNCGATVYERHAQTVQTLPEESVLDETEQSAETAELIMEREPSGSNGRMAMYRSFFAYLRDHPAVLLYGEDYLTVRMMTRYDSDNPLAIHLHNAFFQTLAETGVPGLALILAICVFLLIYSLRILFSPERSAAEKMLPVLLLVLIVDSLAESPLFVPYDEATNSFFNLFFFLVAGYVVELGRKTGGAEPPHNAIGEQN